MSEKELKEYHILFTTFWKIFHKYSSFTGADTDQFWSDLVNDTSAAYQELRNIDKDLAYRLAVATIIAIQDIYRRKSDAA